MSMRISIITTAILLGVSCQSMAANRSLSVDTSSREQTRNFYNGVYRSVEQIRSEWQGDVSQCDAGQTSAAYAEATLLRVNYYRAMAGVPAAVGQDATLGAKAQAAALMMSANDRLSHFPTPDWSCQTPEGIEAAANANLALGSAGFEAVDNLMFDWGDNNPAVGHRRWILFPGTRVMGVGNIEPAVESGYPLTQALWIIDEGAWTRPRPKTRDTFVSWPPEGYLPHPLAPERWSFSYPDADFSQTTVTVQADAGFIPVTLEPVLDGYGDNTLVWVTDVPSRPFKTDARYTVTLDNVRIQGKPARFEYDVVLFDPAQPGPDTVLPAITRGPSRTKAGIDARYTVRKVPNVSGYQWLWVRAASYDLIHDAESGLGALQTEPAQPAYPVLSKDVQATGQTAYHLAQTDQTTTALIWQASFVPGSQSVLQFASRLGWATAEQAADVDVSVDDGHTWITLYHQGGTDSSGERVFSAKTVDLSAYANRLIRLRFHYGSERRFYPQASTGVGWYLDNIRLVRVLHTTTEPQTGSVKNSRFTFTPQTPGRYFLATRAVLSGQYPLEWTHLKPVTVLAP